MFTKSCERLKKGGTHRKSWEMERACHVDKKKKKKKKTKRDGVLVKKKND